MQRDQYPINFTIELAPITKKNSQRMVTVKPKKPGAKPRTIPLPSEQYSQYEQDCAIFMPKVSEPITDYVNVKAIYYLPQKRATDLTNLNEALHDVLTHYNILIDDDNLCIGATDGSRVNYDKEHPRTEVQITLLEEEKAWDGVSKPRNKKKDPVSKEKKSKTKKKINKVKSSQLTKDKVISFDSYLYEKGLTEVQFKNLDVEEQLLLQNNYNKLFG